MHEPVGKADRRDPRVSREAPGRGPSSRLFAHRVSLRVSPASRPGMDHGSQAEVSSLEPVALIVRGMQQSIMAHSSWSMYPWRAIVRAVDGVEGVHGAPRKCHACILRACRFWRAVNVPAGLARLIAIALATA